MQHEMAKEKGVMVEDEWGKEWELLTQLFFIYKMYLISIRCKDIHRTIHAAIEDWLRCYFPQGIGLVGTGFRSI